MSTITEAAEWITLRWDHLQESRLKGTPRPWRQQRMTIAQRAALERANRAELRVNGGRALGESPAPVHLDAVDLSQLIIRRTSAAAANIALELEQEQALISLTRSRPADPHEAIAYIVRNAPKCSDEQQQRAIATLTGLRDAMAQHFQEILDGQQLAAACPWCHEEQLQVRLIGTLENQQPVIICESGTCNPPPQECGTWYKGHPAWPFHEWAWLAERISAT